jgi:hypothetical protein
MPVAYLDVPPGLPTDAKRSMVKRISAAITAAYQLSEVLIFLRRTHSTWWVWTTGFSPRTRSSCKPWNRPRQAKEAEAAPPTSFPPVTALLMGRRTYQGFAQAWPSQTGSSPAKGLRPVGELKQGRHEP